MAGFPSPMFFLMPQLAHFLISLDSFLAPVVGRGPFVEVNLSASFPHGSVSPFVCPHDLNYNLN